MLICKCGCTQFKGVSMREVTVEFQALPEGNGHAPTIIQEGDDIIGVDRLVCTQCGEPATEENLVEAQPCTQCGTMTPIGEVSLEGLCSICANPRPDLQGLSETAYIRKILDLEAQLKNAKHPVSQDTQDAIAQAEKEDAII